MKLHNIQISGSIKNNGEDLTQISSSVATTTLNLSNRIGSLEAKSGSLISGSSQVIYSGITGIPSGIISGSSQLTGSYDARYVLSGSITQTTWDNIANKPTGIVSGSSQVIYSGLTGIPSGIVSGSSQVLNGSGVWSGSAQLPTGIVSGSSQVSYTGLSNTPSGIVSGSSQVISLLPNGTVSGSSQVLNSSGVWSGSAQLPSGVVSGSSQVLNSSGVWSGSAQLPTGIVSGSGQIDILNTLNYYSVSSSLATTDAGIKTRLSSIEALTGSIATTSTNTFIGNQTITGSLYVSQNLIVGGSSSIQYITSSQLTIGDNIISLNANVPALRFSGIEVIDSGSSPQVSGSLLFDSVDNEWIFVHQATNTAAITSSTVITGPETLNNLGNETHLTDNRVPKTINGFHIVDSNTVDDGTTIRHLTNTEVTGTLKITGTIVSSGTSLVSGSSQILNGSGVWSGSAQLPSGIISGSAQVVSSLPAGTVSGSSQVSFTGLSSVPSGLISGSSQVVSALPAGTVSGSSQVLNGSTVWSSSAQLPSGVVSGSSQVLSGTGIWSGSAQLPSGVVSGSSQITFGSISSIPSGLVSGSSQIAYGSITGVPSGLVSGSSQISLTGTTGYGTYINQALLTTSGPTFASLTTTGAVNSTSVINILKSTSGTGGQLAYDTNANQLYLWTSVATGYFSIYTNSTERFKIAADGTTTNNGNVVLHAGNYTSYSGFTTLSASSKITYPEGDRGFECAGAGSVSLYNNEINAGAQGTTGDLYLGWRRTTTINLGVTTRASGTLSVGTASSASGSTLQVVGTMRWSAGGNTYYTYSDMDTGGMYMETVDNNAGRAKMRFQTRVNNAGSYTKYQINADGLNHTWDINGSTYMTLSTSALYVNQYRINPNGTGATYNIVDATNTFAGTYNLQAGGGSSGYGGSLVMYGHSHATRPGYVSAGISSGSGGKFTVQNAGNSQGSDVLTVDANGQMTLINTTPRYIVSAGGYGGSYNTVLGARGGAQGVLQLGNNGDNYIVGGNSVAGGALYFYVNATSDFVTGTNGSRAMIINSNATIQVDGTFYPATNGTQDLGTSSLRWSTVYTSDLSLSNGIGDYTIVEGENDLFLYNNKQNKVYKFMLQEVNAEDATPKKS